VSSAYHELGILPLFELVSWLWFRRPIEDFTLGSEYANSGIRKFCNDLLEARSAKDDLGKDLTSVPALGQTGSIPRGFGKVFGIPEKRKTRFGSLSICLCWNCALIRSSATRQP